jgi:hypothetical protein
MAYVPVSGMTLGKEEWAVKPFASPASFSSDIIG